MKKASIILLTFPLLLTSCSQRKVDEGEFKKTVSELDNHEYSQAKVDITVETILNDGKTEVTSLVYNYLYDKEKDTWSSRDYVIIDISHYFVSLKKDYWISNVFIENENETIEIEYFVKPLAVKTGSRLSDTRFTFDRFGFITNITDEPKYSDKSEPTICKTEYIITYSD